jgi:hypothetical protein
MTRSEKAKNGVSAIERQRDQVLVAVPGPVLDGLDVREKPQEHSFCDFFTDFRSPFEFRWIGAAERH